MEEAGRWALVRASAAGHRRRARSMPRRGRACGARAAAALRRGVLASASSARPRGCRRGASCCASIAGSRSRGEIRGGRFVAGFYRRAVCAARRRSACCARCGASRRGRAGLAVRRRSAQPGGHPHARAAGSSPTLTGNRVLYRDGVPIALLAAGEVQFLETLDTGERVGRAQGVAARRRARTLRCSRRRSAPPRQAFRRGRPQTNSR